MTSSPLGDTSPADTAALLQLLVDGLPDHAMYLIDVNGRVMTWNAGAANIKGYRADEIVGRHLSTFYTSEDVATGKPQRALETARAQGRYSETGRRVRKDGTTFVAQIVLTPIKDSRGTIVGFGKLTRDVTAQVEATEKDQRLRRFLDVVVETMTDGLLVFGKDGTIIRCNQACADIFGDIAHDMVGAKVSDFIPDLARRQEAGRSGAARPAFEEARQEVVGRRRDGGRVWLHVSIGEAELDGETIDVAVLHDLTSRRVIEEKLRQSQRLEAIGRLTGGVAHDFNNILMVISATAENLIDTSGDEEVRDLASRILNSSERASELTNRLLAFARKQPLRPETSDVNAVVSVVGKMLTRTLGEEIQLASRLDKNLWWAHVDRAQLEAAILNLAINARDAMPKGGLLRIETRNATLPKPVAAAMDEVPCGDFVVVSVQDTGAGIDQSVVDRVFEPFFTTKEVGKGTGLGLSMVHGFIKQSGGHIELESELGKGTVVRLYLPRSQARPDDAESDRSAIPGGADRVLVVEDDPHVLNSVASQLASLGYAVTTARDGTEALAVADRIPFDLLITDVVMPGALDGPALVKVVRERKPAIKVLFMSGYAGDRLQAAQSAGHLLSKPFRKRELALAVRSTLDAAAHQESALA